MKVLVLLLLSLQGYAEGNCELKRFRIIDYNNGTYQLQLCNSTYDWTTPTNFISLNRNLCSYCDESPGCDLTSVCVDHINTFLCNYCETTDQCDTCSPFIQPTTTQTPCTCGGSSTTTTKEPTSSEANSELAQIAPLGALTGLFLVTLVLVVTGWVWTCWTMKKKKKETRLCKNCQEGESEIEQFSLNQIRKMTTQPVVGTAIEQLLNSLEESGQSNNGLSSKDNEGHCDVKRVENFYTSSEGSTNSSLQEQQAVNRVEEGESGEKHVYNVLEKPGGDDYEDPDKDLEENTAMEYETPLPLKELRLKHASIHT